MGPEEALWVSPTIPVFFDTTSAITKLPSAWVSAILRHFYGQYFYAGLGRYRVSCDMLVELNFHFGLMSIAIPSSELISQETRDSLGFCLLGIAVSDDSSEVGVLGANFMRQATSELVVTPLPSDPEAHYARIVLFSEEERAVYLAPYTSCGSAILALENPHTDPPPDGSCPSEETWTPPLPEWPIPTSSTSSSEPESQLWPTNTTAAALRRSRTYTRTLTRRPDSTANTTSTETHSTWNWPTTQSMDSTSSAIWVNKSSRPSSPTWYSSHWANTSTVCSYCTGQVTSSSVGALSTSEYHAYGTLSSSNSSLMRCSSHLHCQTTVITITVLHTIETSTSSLSSSTMSSSSSSSLSRRYRCPGWSCTALSAASSSSSFSRSTTIRPTVPLHSPHITISASDQRFTALSAASSPTLSPPLPDHPGANSLVKAAKLNPMIVAWWNIWH
jgi:hypothetical protein